MGFVAPVRAMTRAQFLRITTAATVAVLAPALGRAAGDLATPAAMPTRAIPVSGERLPIVGCGTWIAFDVEPGSAETAKLAGVLQTLFDAGGSAIDSSPMYGRAEAVVGDLLAAAGTRERAFLATKVWTSGRAEGIAQMRASMRLLKTDRIDLMQIHNLLDWRTHLPTLRAMKGDGRIRYLGVTHYTSSAYRDVEAVLRAEQVDFLQINYALDDRTAEMRLLPLAQERGVAVIVNMPFGGGGLLRKLRDRPLPGWAAEIGAVSWAQVLLKYVLGNPAVTCVIPGTSRPEHMAENARAASGMLPDAAMRARIAADF
jgi:diketogulonate reductase-like aldo/keto reductase